jgi:C-terminal processing protease CtpA/Prc
VTEAPTTNLPPTGALQYEGTIGLAALNRLKFVVDGRKHVAYIQPKKTAFVPYEHNRLGAVFLPGEFDLVAQVTDGTPASEAGVCDGDLLLKVNGADATSWRTNRAVLDLVQFWNRPPGTKFTLTLKRGTNILDAPVVLRNILPPDPK